MGRPRGKISPRRNISPSCRRLSKVRPRAYDRRNRDLDPQLVWRGKDEQDWSDLVVQAPPLYIQEKVQPKALIDELLRETRERENEAGQTTADLFADFNGIPKGVDKTEFYQHDQNWSNRMILGDSLQVMASLAEREGLRGKVQCIYFDPPYGIKFNSNFQWSTTSRDVKDGNATHITREPEQVKAFRDTWRDGIHSYLTYLRDRLDASFEALRLAIQSLWSADELQNIDIRTVPHLVLLTLPNDIAAFSVFNGHPGKEFERTYSTFRDLYHKNNREWDERTLSFVVCRSSEDTEDDRFYASLENDPLFCRKYVIRAYDEISAQRGELLRLPFLPLRTPDENGLQRPQSAQDFLQSAGISASLSRKLIEAGHRSAERIT